MATDWRSGGKRKYLEYLPRRQGRWLWEWRDFTGMGANGSSGVTVATTHLSIFTLNPEKLSKRLQKPFCIHISNPIFDSDDDWHGGRRCKDYTVLAWSFYDFSQFFARHVAYFPLLCSKRDLLWLASTWKLLTVIWIWGWIFAIWQSAMAAGSREVSLILISIELILDICRGKFKERGMF